MRVTMFWHGGSSYAAFDVHERRDAEVFESIQDAARSFASRPGQRYYPCVSDASLDDDGPSAWLYFGSTHPVLGQDYHDRIVSFGPRGGVRVDRA